MGALLIFTLQVWDFISDIYFAASMASVLTIDVENDYPNAYSSILSLTYLSIVFVAVPWLMNLFWLVCQRWRWTKHSIVNAWVRDYAWMLFLLCVVSGGADSVIHLCNSNIFALEVFNMQLPRHEYIRQARWATLAVTLFENIPQLVIQGSFLYYYNLLTNGCTIYEGSTDEDASVTACHSIFQSLMFASLSSIFSVIMALGVCVLQCSDPLDDKRFEIHVKLNNDESEDDIRLQLGLRRKIGDAIAKALEMHGSVIKVEAVKWGYNKLRLIVSVTDSYETLEDLSRRRGSIERRINAGASSNLKDELDDEHYDLLLGRFLRAKISGELAGVKLHFLLVVQNIVL